MSSVPSTPATGGTTTAGSGGTVTAPVTMPTRTLDAILTDLEVATQVIGATGVLIPGFGTALASGASIASKLLAIVQAAYDAHVAVMGKPLDLSTLHQETPVS